ncbi:hypothetical protein [Halosimplex marinum]|uniref:hypothetical protein n=1 Tax=Halosimplex marinum TaxID=3396620 RepID=UPI003F56CBFF
MTVDLTTFDRLRTRYPGSSWALWSDSFPEVGCLEEDSDDLVAFLEANRDQLTPAVVFVSLNPSAESPSDCANFHSPSGRHYDDRLKAFIQEAGLDSLLGGYMTDIVPDTVDPDSDNVDPEDADVTRFLDQLDILDQPAYDIICFTGSTFETLQQYFSASVTDRPHNIESFSVTVSGRDLSVYRVWFYGLYGVHQDKVTELVDQLQYLDRVIN